MSDRQRVKTYRGLHRGLNIRVYFLLYANSVEEQRYMTALRREKDSFERLIRERGVSSRHFSADV